MRLSRLFRLDASEVEEDVPVHRVIIWSTVWAAIIVGIALYFKYASLLTPLIG